MKLEPRPLGLPGCYALSLAAHQDPRGGFLKLFHADAFAPLVPGFSPAEIYVTTSHAGVLRGMHFQLPPFDHAKVVVCLSGRVRDVLLDLRGGPNFGRSAHVELSASGENCVLMPKGIAHGFYAQEDGSALAYLVGSVHAPQADAGVLWSSFGHDWPDPAPRLSDRDTRHPRLADFTAPPDWRCDTED